MEQQELETENNKLKQMYADVGLDNKMLKDILSKKFQSLPTSEFVPNTLSKSLPYLFYMPVRS